MRTDEPTNAVTNHGGGQRELQSSTIMEVSRLLEKVLVTVLVGVVLTACHCECTLALCQNELRVVFIGPEGSFEKDSSYEMHWKCDDVDETSTDFAVSENGDELVLQFGPLPSAEAHLVEVELIKDGEVIYPMTEVELTQGTKTCDSCSGNAADCDDPTASVTEAVVEI